MTICYNNISNNSRDDLVISYIFHHLWIALFIIAAPIYGYWWFVFINPNPNALTNLDPRAEFKMSLNMLEITHELGSMVVTKKELIEWCKQNKIRIKEYTRMEYYDKTRVAKSLWGEE